MFVFEKGFLCAVEYFLLRYTNSVGGGGGGGVGRVWGMATDHRMDELPKKVVHIFTSLII